MRVGVIILAAGESRRFGSPKQLAMFRGRTLIENAINAALGTGCRPVVVVLGANADEIEKHVPKAVRVVRNEVWASGMASSIRAGVIAIESEVDAAILTLCDQPLVGREAVMSLAAGAKNGLVATEYQNKTLGVPALFGREYFGQLKALEGDVGAKKILMEQSAKVERVRNPWAELDIDTVEEVRKFMGELGKGG